MFNSLGAIPPVSHPSIKCVRICTPIFSHAVHEICAIRFARARIHPDILLTPEQRGFVPDSLVKQPLKDDLLETSVDDARNTTRHVQNVLTF